MRYQAAPRPGANFDTRAGLKVQGTGNRKSSHPGPAQSHLGEEKFEDRVVYFARLPNTAVCTLSPGFKPNSAARPPAISSTARTGSYDGMLSSDSGFAFAAMRAIAPFALMKSISSGISV